MIQPTTTQLEVLSALAYLQRTRPSADGTVEMPQYTTGCDREPIPGTFDTSRRVTRQQLIDHIDVCGYSAVSDRSVRNALVTFENEEIANSERDQDRRKQYSIGRTGMQILVTIFGALSFETGTTASVNETVTLPQTLTDGYRRADSHASDCIPVVIDTHRPESLIVRILAHKEHRGDAPIMRSELNSPIKQLYGRTSSSDRRAIGTLIDRGVVSETVCSERSRYQLSDAGKGLMVKCVVLLGVSVGATVNLSDQ